MKPIQELNPQSLLDAIFCRGSCPEHRGYSPSEIQEEILRRLSDGYTESLRKRADDAQHSADHRALVNADLTRKVQRLENKVQKILAMACVPAAEYVPALADIIEECDRKL